MELSALLELDGYQPPAFYFTVSFSNTLGLLDCSFKEVSGIKSEMDLEPFQEGGENRFIHQLPKGSKQSKLTLKRGIAKYTSPLVAMCRDVLEGGLISPIKPVSLVVSLLNAEGIPMRSWSFDNVFPVSWEVEAFDAMKNEVAIEKIELSYNCANRII
jgi:phage tail-like protein